MLIPIPERVWDKLGDLVLDWGADKGLELAFEKFRSGAKTLPQLIEGSFQKSVRVCESRTASPAQYACYGKLTIGALREGTDKVARSLVLAVVAGNPAMIKAEVSRVLDGANLPLAPDSLNEMRIDLGEEVVKGITEALMDERNEGAFKQVQLALMRGMIARQDTLELSTDEVGAISTVLLKPLSDQILALETLHAEAQAHVENLKILASRERIVILDAYEGLQSRLDRAEEEVAGLGERLRKAEEERSGLLARMAAIEPDEVSRRALEHEAVGDFDGALQSYNEAVSVSELLATKGRLNRLEFYLRRRDTVSAAMDLAWCLENSPLDLRREIREAGYQWSIAVFELARSRGSIETAMHLLSWAERAFKDSQDELPRLLNNVAQLLQATNRLSESEPLMRRALAIDESSYGPDHPDVAIDLNNLAQLLQATNRLSEAEPLMRRALAIDESSYGPDHPNVARDLNNLAQLLQATNV